jgi:hypothetical protein
MRLHESDLELRNDINKFQLRIDVTEPHGTAYDLGAQPLSFVRQ